MRFKTYFFRTGILIFLSAVLGAQTGNTQSLEKAPPTNKYAGLLNETHFSFPADSVKNVEYDGDPGWGERATVEIKPDARIRRFRSLGFRINIPDFNVLTNKSKSSEFTVGVTLTANSYYGDGNFLDRSFREIGLDARHNYAEQKLAYELRHFALDANDELAKIPAMKNFDIYTQANAAGKVIAFIRCGNSRGEKSICRHSFQIEELKTRITLNYEKKFLPRWNSIQKNSILKLNDFKN